MGKILGIDYGRERVGLAISDEAGHHVFPRQTLSNHGPQKLLAELRSVIAAENVERIVAGLPLTLRGEIGLQATEVQSAMRELSGQLGIPVEFEDERMSSALADRFPESSYSRDSLAAAAILESYLERQRAKGRASRI